MFKIANALIFTLLLTSCVSQDTQDTNTSTVKNEKAIQTIEKSVKTETETKVEVEVDKNTSKEETSLFTLTTLEGKTIHINETKGGLEFKEYKDKVVLVLFFGHRCPPCLGEIPVLTALINKGHKDLEIIAIEVQGLGEEQLKDFKKSKGINYTLIANTSNSNFVNYIAKQTSWSGAIPFLIGFDKASVVKVVHAGGLGAKDFDNIYNDLAKGE